jgi:acetyl esterase/lipase
LIQIATWNDYGEGTVIEPTRDRGYRALELIQRERGVRKFGAADLRLPVMLYQLRKRAGREAAVVEILDRASAHLFEGKCMEAEALLAKVGTQLGQQPAKFADSKEEADPDYRLVSEVLYREEGGLSGSQHQRCRLDLYFPVKNQPYSTVVWFHGGGLTAGERFVPMALRRRGIAVAAVNYRLAPDAKSPEYIEDAAAAVAWVMKNVANFGGAQNRVFVSGHSAGAYLTLMLGLDRRWLKNRGVDPDTLAGLIPLSPQTITHFAIREERGGDEKQTVVDDLAPLFHVRKDAPPILLVTGDREKEMLGRYEENAYFWRMMKVAGHRNIVLRELQGFDHGRMADPAMPLLLEFVKEQGAIRSQAR